MNIVRKIKLNQLGYHQLNDNEKKILNIIKRKFLDLKIIKLDKYPYIHFYTKEDIILFHHDLYSENIWLNYYEFYKKINILLNSYTEYQNLLKYILKCYYNIDIEYGEINFLVAEGDDKWGEVMKILKTNSKK